MKLLYLPFLLLFFLQNITYCQIPKLNIAIISDDNSKESKWFETEIIQEITDLLATKYEITFVELFTNSDPAEAKKFIENAFTDPKVDLIITTGVLGSNVLAKQDFYPKPAIASVVIDQELQNVPKTSEGTSGISNFTYVVSPFNLFRDVNTLYEIVPFKKLGILGGMGIIENVLDVNVFYNKLLETHHAEYAFIPISGNVDDILNNIPNDVEAIYLLPIFTKFKEDAFKELLEGISDKNLPCFSILSNPYLQLGAYAAYDSDPTLKKIPRRIALNVSKVLDGINASDLPVEMINFEKNLIVNMKTANKIKIFPSIQTLVHATLINVNQMDTDREINLKSCIAEAISNNLTLKIVKKESELAVRDVAIAKSDYLPHIDAFSTGVLIDSKSAESSFGTKGEFTWSVGGDLSQLILSEPALANIAIQKLFLDAQHYYQDATELDIVLDVAEAYFNILLAEAFVKIQTENVAVTQKNYDISLAKEAVGYAGTTDVHRWESQLALNKIDLNDSNAKLMQARYQLNQILNRPIKEAFITSDSNKIDREQFENYLELIKLIDNPADLESYADFLVNEAFINLPEIKQLEKTIDAQNRLVLSNKRAYYLPTIALKGQYDYDLKRIGVTPLPGQAPQEIFPAWNTVVSLQIPVFQGTMRNNVKQQNEIEVLKSLDNLNNLRNKLELQVRSDLETVRASFGNWLLSTEAAIASRENFKISQDSYRQGLLNITSLIDAQNAALQSELNESTSKYQFVLDFMSTERAIGKYYFLLPWEDQLAFIQRYVQFKNNNK